MVCLAYWPEVLYHLTLSNFRRQVRPFLLIIRMDFWLYRWRWGVVWGTLRFDLKKKKKGFRSPFALPGGSKMAVRARVDVMGENGAASFPVWWHCPGGRLGLMRSRSVSVSCKIPCDVFKPFRLSLVQVDPISERFKMSDEGKLFVGGLNFDTTEESLELAFSKYGNISKIDVIRDRETHRSRGFGFVTFENPDDAKDALEGMNGKTVDGRAIRVDEAGKSGSRSGGGYRGGPSGGRGGGFFRGGRGGRGGGGYGGGDRSYGSDRGYGDRNYGGGDRGYGGGYSQRSGGYSGGGGGGGYYNRDRGQSGYSDRPGSYREGYDSYTANE